MSTFRYVVADVFTDTPLAGNQLAVFTDARDIPTSSFSRWRRSWRSVRRCCEHLLKQFGGVGGTVGEDLDGQPELAAHDQRPLARQLDRRRLSRRLANLAGRCARVLEDLADEATGGIERVGCFGQE